MSTAIVWFRRDLRLADQPALHQACARHSRIIPLFIWNPGEDGAWAPGGASRWWLHHALEGLDTSLRALGSRLLLRQGNSLDTLLATAREAGAAAVYWTRLYEPERVRQDSVIKTALRSAGLEARSFNAALLKEPWEVATGAGGPYRVFTPFWRAAAPDWDALSLLPAPEHLDGHGLEGTPLAALQLLPKLGWASRFPELWTPGEDGAHQQLQRFCDHALAGYRERRDWPGEAPTSALSPHLHFGEISPRQAALRIRRQAQVHPLPGLLASADHYLRELGWREFAHHLLYHFPHTPQQPLDPRYAPFPWRRTADYRDDLTAWQQGRTGIPIVDAGMRQLWQHGWMHNRVRMIVASFLTKNLLIPWQDGAAWFWDTLLDASLANNTLGWQWVAGCGADAAPYFRVFNPVLQSEKFDAHGAYLHSWLPELRVLSGRALHQPWAAGRQPAGYPAPIVDLATSRLRALAAWDQLRSG